MVKKHVALMLLSLVMITVNAENPFEVKVIKLSNGFTVWLNEDHQQPKVYGAVVVKAGAKDCPNTGIAHYFEHLLFKGTDRIGTIDYKAEKPWLDSISAQYDLLGRTTESSKRRQIQNHINQLSLKAAEYAIPGEFENLITTYGGTGLNAYTSFDETVYHNTFSPQYIEQWCVLNSERLISPVFRLFQGELETVYEEKNMYSDQMIAQAAEAGQRLALAGTPYAYPIIGSTENLKNPRLSEMKKFFEQYYVAGNMGLVLCGDFQTQQILPILEHTFGRIRRGIVPNTEKSKLRDMRGGKVVKLKVPIPIVKAGGYAFKAPSESSDDYLPFIVMKGLLSNNSETGLLDSLTHDNKLMVAGGMGYDFKDFSVYGFAFVPNIPFGSRKQADRMCWEQVDKLRRGAFSEERLEAEKTYIKRQMQLSLESSKQRSGLMINAFSHDLSWESVVSQAKRLEAVTREDVVRVAQAYINDDSLKVVKTFGSYDKERVSQPGYKPVSPKNTGRRSAFADSLARLPRTPVIPKFVDFNSDVSCEELSPLVRFYSVPNPMNDISSLQLIYRRGAREDRRIDLLGSYLNRLGTSRHTKQQLGRALQRIGAGIYVGTGQESVTVTLSVFDSNFKAALRLLREFLTETKANEDSYKRMVKAVRLDEKAFFKDNQNIADAVFAKVEFGDSSAFLRRLTTNELKKMRGEDFVNLFKEIQHSQLDVIYSGNLPVQQVKTLVREEIPLEKVNRAWKKVDHQLCEVREPVVYVYDNPDARQTILGSFQQLAAMPNAELRTLLDLWGNYFGSGMSSVLFQDIREFRAYAYSAYGRALTADLKRNPNAYCGYFTRIGTQSDKAMQALSVLDSLLTDMPVRKENIVVAQQELLNAVNNNYPSFRNIGKYVADYRLLGYLESPERETVSILSELEKDAVVRFYRNQIVPRTKAFIVVGNKKALDFAQLKKLGRVVMLKDEDIYRE